MGLFALIGLQISLIDISAFIFYSIEFGSYASTNDQSVEDILVNLLVNGQSITYVMQSVKNASNLRYQLSVSAFRRIEI